MNDKANSFACVQVYCNGPVCPSRSSSCYFTVCPFDVAPPSGNPYISKLGDSQSCTPLSCQAASDSSKIKCTNNLCCT